MSRQGETGYVDDQVAALEDQLARTQRDLATLRASTRGKESKGGGFSAGVGSPRRLSRRAVEYAVRCGDVEHKDEKTCRKDNQCQWMTYRTPRAHGALGHCQSRGGQRSRVFTREQEEEFLRLLDEGLTQKQALAEVAPNAVRLYREQQVRGGGAGQALRWTPAEYELSSPEGRALIRRRLAEQLYLPTESRR